VIGGQTADRHAEERSEQHRIREKGQVENVRGKPANGSEFEE
jgi:hypothetical protein